MPKNQYHNCAICGAKYHFCSGCMNVKTYTPWRTIVDNVEHYKIFIILRDYNNKNIDKSTAKKQLQKCDLNGLENFVAEVKVLIEDILSYEE
ncbi:hypothetical protein [Anaerocolumna xylanovorans]|uniref:Uncharacterized protein n=1 Tax=Anaerocolumna xylanovorans DSM 12503 TaxID=1121345 RepID=A0A1M7YM61_9FIRM|nr:hypothetical protein [Anaerocolumna xylanovorans]SHO53688.1 hypothetical protein SAMN02745217_04236 [Anaerocolumna xylanovorans DSM 12503]